MIRYLIVDDHAAFRQPLAFLLGREPGCIVAAQAGSLHEAHHLFDGIDVALIDRGLPDGDGAMLIQAFRAVNPRGQVVLLAGPGQPSDADLLAPEGSSMVHKSATLIELLVAARQAGGALPA